MISNIVETIQEADVVLVFAGAGMSAESNLPTFRDNEGFWNDYPYYRSIKKSHSSLMSSHSFFSDPKFAWGFYGHRDNLYTNAIPHDGYLNLLNFCQSKKDFFIVTTNVDGLFLKAGFPQEKLHEAHGSIHKLQCVNVCQRTVWKNTNLNLFINYDTMRVDGLLPKCKYCDSVARPNIFMFGDTDDTYVWEEAQPSAKAFREWREEYKKEKIVIFEIGVGAEGLKSHVDKYLKEFLNVSLIKINPENNKYSEKNIYSLQTGAKEALKKLCEIKS